MSVDRLMRDIESAAWQTVEKTTRLRPGKCPGALGIIQEVGADVILGALPDPLPFHG
jgi:hypothetical protein